ncbi:HEAT repeat domain-containing protein [candidate division KSB1 bacterium]|nr:HEAT repeat domain-containing protein [candidate division KSB1 bacterium]NIW73016.1 hypothetical protein [candidate division KSB1 bacterium]NIX74382.1 hypothetical protein [candidate division KSB1 bacterium]
MQSFDDRIRGGAALAAEGCLFEPYILDLVFEIAENDGNPAIRKAAIQTLSQVIHEGVMQNMEDEIGASTAVDDVEEWEEYQAGDLRDDYLRVRHLLMNLLEDEDDPEMQELALFGLADLGFLPEVREKIADFISSNRKASQLVALKAMGRYPQYWEDHLEAMITPDAPTDILQEAISACYSSDSSRLAKAIEGVLEHSNPEVLRFALLTLANINKSENLADILQQFSLHQDTIVQEAARDGLELINKKNFSDFLRTDLGMED